MDDNPRTIEKPTQIKLFDLREVGYPEKGGQLKIDLADENDGRELDHATVDQVWKHFYLLREDEPYRCHNPRFGMKFYEQSKVYFEATICWSCNNIFGRWNGEQWGYNFHGNEENSQALLNIFTGIFGESDPVFNPVRNEWIAGEY